MRLTVLYENNVNWFSQQVVRDFYIPDRFGVGRHVRWNGTGSEFGPASGWPVIRPHG
jgi:hypothetical protein